MTGVQTCALPICLTYVYGIGQSTADEILAGTGINPDTRVKDLSADDEAKIRDYIDKNNIIVEGDLRRNVALDIKRLVNTDDESFDEEPPADEDFSLFEEEGDFEDDDDLFVIADDNLDD